MYWCFSPEPICMKLVSRKVVKEVVFRCVINFNIDWIQRTGLTISYATESVLLVPTTTKIIAILKNTIVLIIVGTIFRKFVCTIHKFIVFPKLFSQLNGYTYTFLDEFLFFPKLFCLLVMTRPQTHSCCLFGVLFIIIYSRYYLVYNEHTNIWIYVIH